MQAWLVQGEQGTESDALGYVFRQWAGRPENKQWSVDCVRWTAELAPLVQARRPDVLVLAEPSCPAGSWTAEVLACGIGLVAATALERAESYRALSEQYAIQLTPLPPSVEGMGLAVLNVMACLRRQRAWQVRIDQLQQRLNDRIVIERAKGILVERLGVSEKEAYKRLRVLSRRQRRQIRDIAQALIDTQALLLPEMNGFVEPPPQDLSPPLDRSEEAP
jgi:AmiR/NasT family two-component response regulator